MSLSDNATSMLLTRLGRELYLLEAYETFALLAEKEAEIFKESAVIDMFDEGSISLQSKYQVTDFQGSSIME